MEKVENELDELLYRKIEKIPLEELLKDKLTPPKGKSYAIIDKYSAKILSFCSKDYTLRENSGIFLPFEQLLKDTGHLFNREIKVFDGNKFYVDYIIRSKVKSKSIIDILPMISIWNSYDGTVKTQIKFGYHKLLCKNKLSRPVGCQINVAKKHSVKDEEFTINNLTHFLSMVEQFLKETQTDIKTFERLHSNKVSIETFDTVAKHFKLSKEAKEVAAFRIEQEQKPLVYQNENGDMVNYKPSPLTMFIVYNAINHAIYNTNPKELPEVKSKKDKSLIDYICRL
jgi:hypothetical protein